MKLALILGTAREGRQSEKVARFLLNQAGLEGHKVEFLDVRDYKLCVTDRSETQTHVKKFREILEGVDAIMIVSPEYNGCFPGELKLLLDTLFSQYSKKPVGIAGVSAGAFGGVKVVNALQSLMLTLGAIPIPTPLYFPKVQDLFDRDGNIKDKGYVERSRAFFKELEAYAKGLSEVV